MATRRRALQAGVALTTATWVAPSVLTLDRVAAATPSVPCEVPSTGAGALWLATPPTSVVAGGPLENNTNTYVFLEQGPVQLTSNLAVNRTAAGTFNGNSNPGGAIASGTWICSYLVHGDRLTSGFLTGSLAFSTSTIVGLIYQNAEITASDFLRSPATTYSASGRRMEGGDSMTFNGTNTLSWNMRFGGAVDQIRVIVTC